MQKAVTPQQLAEQWCSKHPEVISSDASAGSAMDKAVKIIALETSTEKGRSDLFRAAAPFGVSFLDSVPGQPHPATDFLSAKDLVPTTSQQQSPGVGGSSSSKPSPSSPAAGASSANMAPKGTLASNLGECPYCREPSSRFCKESGRRHETSDEKAERRWKHVFRQLSLASSFVSNVRLSKKNTCVSDDAVELIF